MDELDMRDLGGCVEGSRDFVSSGLAGMVVGGMWSAWNGFGIVTAARTIRLGVAVGLAFGLAQDGLALVRGKTVGYAGEGESWLYRGAKNRIAEGEEGAVKT